MSNLEDLINKNKHKTQLNSVTIHDLDIDSDNLKLQINSKKLENERYKSDTLDRKWLALWTAAIVSSWLMLVLLILIFNRILNINLTDNVLITLLGTTTLNVLGLSFIVLRGHFYYK